jgi:Uma2 family endonuclease
MSVALRKPMTTAEFLEWEERQEFRFEFDGERPVAMTGGTLGHEDITFNVRKALDARLAGGRCRPFGPNAKIIVAGRVRYPDVVVVCSPQDRRTTIAQAPVVVFEVISDGTSRTDRIEKLREYFAIPSIRRYVILEQDSVAATVLERGGDAWRATALTGGDVLAMPEIGINLPLAECYAGVDVGAAEADPEALPIAD